MIQTITDYMPLQQTFDSSSEQPECLELNKSTPSPGNLDAETAPGRWSSRTKACKATGSDNTSGCVLRVCRETHRCLDKHILYLDDPGYNQRMLWCLWHQSCFKEDGSSCFNGYRHILITGFEWLVMQQIKSVLPHTLDPGLYICQTTLPMMPECF